MSIGDLARQRGGKWALTAPARCRAGHQLTGGNVLVGTTACRCGTRHTTWECRHPGCHDTTYAPPQTAACTPTFGIDGR